MSIYKRKSGRWAVLIDVDRRADGKRRRRALGTYDTRKAAERAEREALAARDRGIDLSPTTVTVAELLARFVADRRTKGRAVTTIERYDEIARTMIVPRIGAIPLAKLSPAHVSEMVVQLTERGSKKGTPLSAKSVKHALTMLSTALRWALRHQLVVRNVADAVDSPTVPRSRARALTEDEARRFLAEVDAGAWGPFFRLALATGARRGELLALRWTDVDLDRRMLTIRAALAQTHSAVVEKGTKTDRVRTLPLGELGMDALRRQRAAQARDRLAAGESFVDSGHLFQGPLGGWLTPLRATDAFRRAAQRIKLAATLHCLRHTAGTWMIANGVDVRTVASILGHSTAVTTLGIYAHVLPGAQGDAVATIDARLARGSSAS